MLPFSATSNAALHFAEKLTDFVRTRLAHNIPSLLELQTICRETGVTLHDLETFAQVLDSPPALLIIDGSVDFTQAAAIQFGLDATVPALPDAPLVWSLRPGTKKSIRIQFGGANHEISENALAAFLTSSLDAADMIIVEQTVECDARWRLLWVPHPERIEPYLDSKSAVEMFLSHQAVVYLCDTPSNPIKDGLKEHGQKSWMLPPAEADFGDARAKLLAELHTLLDEQEPEREIRRARQWQWLAKRLSRQIDESSKQYATIQDRHEGHMRNCRHMLQQYKKNWTGGIHNLLEEYIQSRLSQPAMGNVFQPKSSGKQVETFLSAVSFNTLSAKLDAFMTDKMAEFISGMGALASKLDLIRIPLSDANMHWNTRSLQSACDAALQEKKVLPDTGKKRGGLVRNLTGRSSALSEESKAALLRAGRATVQCIEREFTAHTDELVKSIEDIVRLQLTAALANSGLPDPDRIQTAMEGLERLSAAISGKHRDHESRDRTVSNSLISLGADLHLSRYRLAT